MALRRKFQQTKLFRALLVVACLLLFMFFPPRFLFEPAQALFRTVAWPVETFFSSVAFALRDTAGLLGSIGHLKNENETLERERQELLGENARLRELARENESLRRELGLLPREKYELVASDVVGRGTKSGDSILLINSGSHRGVAKDMPVVVGSGILVGRVLEVFPYSASIMLLSHPSSFVNGVTEESEAKGIVKGEHGLGLLFDIVLQSDTLTSGDRVITSGLDRGIPRGLLMGTLQAPGLSADRLYQRASLLSPVSFEDLRHVFVIKNTLAP